MSLAQLRYAPWHDKCRLSPSQYESLTAAVSKVLCHTISIPDTGLDVTWAREFVRTYAQDVAKHTLQVLDEDANEAQSTPHEVPIRRLTFCLAQRLSKVRDGLDVSILVNLAVSYGVERPHSLRTIFQDACTTAPTLRESFMGEVVPAFGTSLQDVQNRSISSTRKVAFVLSQLLRCGPIVVKSFVQTKDFVLTLARSYHAGLDNFANYHGGITLQIQDSEAASGWQSDWLYTKVSLVDSFHAIVQTLLQGEQPNDKDHLFELLFSISELPSSSTSEYLTPIPFITQSLLADYQYAFDLSGVLSERFKGVDDARVDLLASMLVGVSLSPHGTKPAGGLSLLIKDTRRVEPTADLKGKGKAKASSQYSESEANMDQAIAQVKDIFPSYSIQHIRYCLDHPLFAGDPEKLISSLLEDNLPPELADNREAPGDVPPVEDFKYVKDRRNIWDEDRLDFSRLRIGKARDTADALLHDRSFVEQMKADIIRRAEEISSDEEVVIDKSLAGRGQTPAFFEEELDDDPLADKGVKVAGDGEASDDSDDQTEDTLSPETILELAYLDDPNVFDRDSATRRSKARAELKLKTGWVDEQIEGWRVMLERNPKKDKILQKHEFSGNTLLVTNTNALEPGPSDNTSASRGGRTRGRGGNRGTDVAHDRASKEKNKARSANHNRKRGHDKKMTRGAVPAA